MIKIAIVTRPQNSSPRILAETLQQFLSNCNTKNQVFYRVNTFKRLIKYKDVKHKYKFFQWVVYKMIFYVRDKMFIRRLKSYDAIIISDCTPISFLKETYNIEKLRKIMGAIPIIFYEVYYLANAPTQIEALQKMNQPLFERFNWHLSVTNVTEIKSKVSSQWSHIGLYLKGSGLKPVEKKRHLAIVDFAQPGHEYFREQQISILEQLKIPYISLKGRFTIEEIRNIYKEATFYFMQSSESFGLPIAECLSCGSYILTPDSSWPMSWRLDENPTVHGPGILADCFIVYDGAEDLKKKLEKIMKDYDFIRSPQEVFDIFFRYYQTFYEGSQIALIDLLQRIESQNLN